MTNLSKGLRQVWVLQDAEPIPGDPNYRQWRATFIAEALIERGYKVIWFTSHFDHANKIFRASPPTIEVAPNLHIKLLNGPGYKKNISLMRLVHQACIGRSFLRHAEQLLPPEFIISSWPSPELACAAARYSKSSGPPLFIDVRDPWPSSFEAHFSGIIRIFLAPIRGYYRSLGRIVAHQLQGISSISQGQINWAQSFFGKKNIPAHVAYMSYRKDALSPSARSATQGRLNLLFVGTLSKTCNLEPIISAVLKLHSQHPDAVNFRIVGDGEEMPRWKNQAGSCNAIEFSGWLSGSELNAAILNASVGIIPPMRGMTGYYLGNKIFEYMANSLAIISFEKGEIASLLNRYKCGIAIDNDCSSLFEEIVLNYVHNKQLLTDHRGNAFNAYLREFTPAIIYTQLVNFYESVTHSNQSQRS